METIDMQNVRALAERVRTLLQGQRVTFVAHEKYDRADSSVSVGVSWDFVDCVSRIHATQAAIEIRMGNSQVAERPGSFILTTAAHAGAEEMRAPRIDISEQHKCVTFDFESGTPRRGRPWRTRWLIQAERS